MKRLKEFFEVLSDPTFWKVLPILLIITFAAIAGIFEGVVQFLAYWRIAFGH